MTHVEVLQLLSPIVSAVILAVASVLGIVLTFGSTRLRLWLDSKNQAAASAIVADATVRVQAAMANGAGTIALGIQTGRIDPTSLPQMRQAAEVEAGKIAAKIPDALAVLRPLENSVIEGVMAKITRALPAVVTEAPVAAPAAP